MLKKENKFSLVVIFVLFTSLAIFPIVTVTGKDDLGPPLPPFPYGGAYWDFNVSDVFGWEVETLSNGTLMDKDLQIYNVTNTPFGYPGNMTSEYYWVELEPLYWNTTDRSLNPVPFVPPKNVSLINFTYNKMFEDDENLGPPPSTGPPPAKMPNLFIPKNDSILLLDWCANALNASYEQIIGPSPFINTLSGNSTIMMQNDNNPSHVYLDYDSQGVLEFGEIYKEFGPNNNLTFVWKRVYDFDPLNEVSWSVNVGDKLYYGIGENETQFDIVNIINWTEVYMDHNGKPRYKAYQIVQADISIWDFKLEQWNFTGVNSMIGVANDKYFHVWNDDFDMPMLVLPLYATGEDLAHEWSRMPEHNETSHKMYDSVTRGNLWIRLENSSTLEHEYYGYFPSGNRKGVLNYSDSFHINNPEPPIFYKNYTMLLASLNQIIPFEGYTVENIYDIVIDISSFVVQELYFAAFPVNPFDIPLTDSMLFIDIMAINVGLVNYPINLTINYYSTFTGNYELFYFNLSTKTWILETIYDDGFGTLTASLNHASIFGLTLSSPSTATEPPGPFNLSSNADIPIDTDGAFTLSWTSAVGATNYTIYRYDANFTTAGDNTSTINGTIISIATEISSLSLSISGLGNGTYFFVAVAHNAHGNSTSNIIKIVVGISEDLLVPFGDFYLYFTIIGIVAIVLYVKRKKIRKT
jgi:hypothetical protein